MATPTSSPRRAGDLLIHGQMPACGESLRVPGDKSISHRALLIGAITPGATEIRNMNRGSAVELLLEPLRQLGCEIDDRGETLRIARVRQPDGVPRLFLGGSSAAARLLIGILAGTGTHAIVDGDEILRTRPMDWLVDPLRALGAVIDYLGEPGCLPVAVRGGAIRPGTVTMTVGSAQARSGVVLASVTAGQPVVIRYAVRSRDHTERLLGHAGARIEQDDTSLTYHGGALGAVPVIEVPGDPSLAAYPAAARLLRGSGPPLVITGVCLNPTRTGFFDVLRGVGASIHYRPLGERHGEPVGDIVVDGGCRDLGPFDVRDDFTVHALIDEIPLLCALAAAMRGVSTVSRAEELSFKETNRLDTTRGMVAAFGAQVAVDSGSIRVTGGGALRPGQIPSFGDHRIAMAGAVLAGSLAGPSRIVGGTCYATSFPGFIDTMYEAGVSISVADDETR
jgi:3-phosphoshikimate 1-carboxyvinyltransferase